MLSVKLPVLSKAPIALHTVDGSCGPLAAWGVLRHFHKRTSAARILKMCRHNHQHGAFAIALSVALREHGLWVEFYTEPDPAPQPTEVECYLRAAELGICVSESPELETILAFTGPSCVPIIFYDTDDGSDHFSPITGTDDDGQVLLPYSDEKRMPIAKLHQQWSAPGICRQCILVRPHYQHF